MFPYLPEGMGFREINKYKKIFISGEAYSDSRYVFVGNNGGIVYPEDLDS